MSLARQRSQPAFLRAIGLVFACAVVLMPLSLSAHHLPPELEEVDEFADAAFRAGLRHPSQGWDHWLLAAAAGLMAASWPKRRDQVLTGLAFVGGLTAATWLPVLSLPGGIIGLFAGGLLLIHFARPHRWQIAVLGMAAVLQAQDHLAAWPWEQVRSAYWAGSVAASTALFSFVAGGVCLMRGLIASNRLLAPA